MAIIDKVLPLTTLISFVGGNSGQMTIELMRYHNKFCRFDLAYTDELGRYCRSVMMPFSESQYATRLPYHNLDPNVGQFSWIRNDATKQWLRSQCEDWFMTQWEINSIMDIEEVLFNEQIITIPTHLSPDFMDFVMPESRKVFIVDDNAYFATRADEAKNPDKHPTDIKSRFKYLSHRVATHRAWNNFDDFNRPNSVVINRSRLFNTNLSIHSAEMSKLFILHGIEASEPLLDKTHEMVLRYLEAQVAAGYFTNLHI